MFTPPGTRDTIEMPGNNGGANFGARRSTRSPENCSSCRKIFPAMLKLQLSESPHVTAFSSPEDKGHAIFASNCQLCHGVDRKGRPPATPLLVNITDTLNADRISNIVRHGMGQMPAFSGLSQRDIENLLLYLRQPPSPASLDDDQSSVPLRPHGPASDLEYKTPFGFMFTSSGLPAISPPWTTLTAYDLNRGTIEWQVSLAKSPN